MRWITITVKPWVDGPLELLKHGIEHLSLGKSFDMRMAIILIDNSVEVMIKTYLKLPKRVTGTKRLSRADYDKKTTYFSSLLDTIEEKSPEKLIGIELGDIEWYHDLRNKLYHDGTGITVEKEKVEGYAEIAKILFFNLFKLNVEDFIDVPQSIIGKFFGLWALFEQELVRVYTEKINTDGHFVPINNKVDILEMKGIISESFIENFNSVRQFRNNVAHGLILPSADELKSNIKILNDLFNSIREME